MRCEHFVRGSFHNVGYRTVATLGTPQILTRDSYSYLQNMMGDNTRQTLLGEGYVAVTKLTPTKDEYGRDTTWNHTILIPARDYLTLAWDHAVNTVVESHFIPPTAQLGGLKLEPLVIHG